jgi:hypothetical protein
MCFCCIIVAVWRNGGMRVLGEFKYISPSVFTIFLLIIIIIISLTSYTNYLIKNLVVSSA